MHFYYFSHMLQPWILPPGLNVLLAVIGYTVSHFAKLVGQIIIAIALISLWFFCTPITAQLLMDGLQNQYPKLQMNQISKNSDSAIIALSGDYEPSLQSKKDYMLSKPTQSRIHYAAYLYQKTHFPVITSGGPGNKSVPSAAELMREQLQNYFNVPVKWIEDKSKNTKDQARFMLPIVEKEGVKTIYLVTNAWHMPRTMYTFKHSFKHTDVKIIAAPMGYSELQLNRKISNFLPSFKALNTSVTAMHEYVGMLVYRLSNILKRL